MKRAWFILAQFLIRLGMIVAALQLENVQESQCPPQPSVPTVSRFCSSTTTVVCSFGPEIRNRKKAAVLVVGVKDRFYPLPGLKHVVAPAVRAGYQVDYFVLLISNLARSAFSKDWLQPVPVANPGIANMTGRSLQDYVAKYAKHFGAHRAHVYLLESDVFADPFPDDWSRWFGRGSGASTMFFNELMRLKKIEMLWNYTAQYQVDGEYSRVLVTRDDAFWIDDVHLEHFADPWTVYSTDFVGLCCKPATTPDLLVPSDRVFVMHGRVAARFLTFYSEYYTNPRPELDVVNSVEHFQLTLARIMGFRWEIVRQDWFPFFLAMHTKGKHSGRGQAPFMCFRQASNRILSHPTGPCVHPMRVRHPFCDQNETCFVRHGW